MRWHMGAARLARQPAPAIPHRLLGGRQTKQWAGKAEGNSGGRRVGGSEVGCLTCSPKARRRWYDTLRVLLIKMVDLHVCKD